MVLRLKGQRGAQSPKCSFLRPPRERYIYISVEFLLPLQTESCHTIQSCLHCVGVQMAETNCEVTLSSATAWPNAVPLFSSVQPPGKIPTG